MAVKKRGIEGKKVGNFKALPDVLIQDTKGAKQYLIPSHALTSYEVTAPDWASVGPETVVFRIPDGNQSAEVPPFLQLAKKLPSILIQWPTGKKAFFLSNAQLRKFSVKGGPAGPNDYGISFILPVGLEMIRELPQVMRAMLQSGESSVNG